MMSSTAMKCLGFFSMDITNVSLSLTAHFQTAVPKTLQDSDRTLTVLLKLEV